MRLIIKNTEDKDYCAKIVEITNFRNHNDPEVNKLKCCSIDGFNIITGIDAQPGLYVYFPALSQINPDFLSYCNLYRKSELNNNPEESGMFEENGRVKAIKLRGEISEGFIISLDLFKNYIISVTGKELENAKKDQEFDSVEEDDKTFWINRKYIIRTQTYYKTSGEKQRYKLPTRLHLLREDQFKFHYETTLIKKCPFVLTPNSLIHISSKWHGTSGISAYVLCHQELNWKQKIAKWLTGESFDKYDYVWSSRTVIKNPYYNPYINAGYYNDKMREEVHKLLAPSLIKGMTYYYEIVGYDPSGSPIQKQSKVFDYGCVPPESDNKYIPGKNFKVRIYRITLTNPDGEIHEFSTQEVKQWCNKVGLYCVDEFYYGLAKNLYPELDPLNHWNENFIDKLSNDKRFYMEMNSPDCVNKVPQEGIVIKIEDGKSRAFKLKCFRFLDGKQKAQDVGQTDTEDLA